MIPIGQDIVVEPPLVIANVNPNAFPEGAFVKLNVIAPAAVNIKLLADDWSIATVPLTLPKLL